MGKGIFIFQVHCKGFSSSDCNKREPYIPETEPYKHKQIWGDDE